MTYGHARWATFRRISMYCMLAAAFAAGPAAAQADDAPLAGSRAARMAEAERWERQAEAWKLESEQWRQEAVLWQEKASVWHQQTQEWEAKAGAWERQAGHWQREAEGQRAEVEALHRELRGEEQHVSLTSEHTYGSRLRHLNEHERPDYAGDRRF